jgi:hypothetical protein
MKVDDIIQAASQPAMGFTKPEISHLERSSPGFRPSRRGEYVAQAILSVADCGQLRGLSVVEIHERAS